LSLAAPPSEGLPADRRQGLQACRAALRDCLLALAPDITDAPPAPAHPAPVDLCCVDPDFAGWPLEEPEVLRALTTWLCRPGRRLVLIGDDFETTAMRLPRFARWRRDHGHRIDAWRPTEPGWPDGLRGLWVGTTAWRWLDTQEVQLLRITDPAQRQAFKAEIADFLQRCEPAWPVTTLGL